MTNYITIKIVFLCSHFFIKQLTLYSFRMGRIFLEHMGGARLFSCARCDTNLTNRMELISTRFTGATGRAFLFNRVVNLTYSDVQDRVMLTGRHMVTIYIYLFAFLLSS